MRRLLLLFVAALTAWSVRAEISTNTSYDALFLAATRYGNTEARRAEKEAAREELFRRGPGTLREIMDRFHMENVMLQVLAVELVRERLPGPEAASVLMEFLDDERLNVRRGATYLLGFCPPTDSYARLLTLLREDQTRNAALRTLGKWKVGEAHAEIRRLLREGEKERTRVLAANALRDFGDKQDLSILIEALGDPVFTVRNTAARAIASFGRAAHRPLLKALPESTGVARRQIVRLLGELQVESARRPARRLLEDADAGLRADVERALRELEDGPQAEPLFVLP